MENKETAQNSLAVSETRQDIAGGSTEATSSTAAAQATVTQASSSNPVTPSTAMCPICGEDQGDLAGYYIHSISFHRQCPWCKNDFGSIQAIEKHLKKEPCKSLCSEDIMTSCFDRRFICFECYGKTGAYGLHATNDALYAHIEGWHVPKPCPYCSKVLPNEWKWKAHLWGEHLKRFDPEN